MFDTFTNNEYYSDTYILESAFLLINTITKWNLSNCDVSPQFRIQNYVAEEAMPVQAYTDTHSGTHFYPKISSLAKASFQGNQLNFSFLPRPSSVGAWKNATEKGRTNISSSTHIEMRHASQWCCCCWYVAYFSIEVCLLKSVCKHWTRTHAHNCGVKQLWKRYILRMQLEIRKCFMISTELMFLKSLKLWV